MQNQPTLQKLRILLVDGACAQSAALAAGLSEWGYLPDVVGVDTQEQLVAGLEPRPDLIVTGAVLDGLDAKVRGQVNGLDIPWMVSCSEAEEEQALDCLRQGAADYWLGEHPRRMGHSVSRMLEGQRLKQEVKSQIKAEESLRASEGRLKLAMRLARLGIWDWDIATDRVVWSEEMFPIYGIDPQDFSGHGEDYIRFTHPEYIEIQRANIVKDFEQAARQARETGETTYISPNPKELRLIRPDGGVTTTLGNAVVIVDAGGKPLRMLGITQDISERKLAEEKLRDARQQLEAVIQASPVAIDALDRDGRVTLWNPAAERLFGWTAEEVLGGELPFMRTAWKGEVHQMVREETQGVVRDGIEIIRPRKDGSLVDIRLSSAQLYDNRGKINGAMVILEDISQRKLAEAALRASEERLRASEARLTDFLESAQEGFIALDRDWRYIFANRAYGQIFGCDPQGLIGQNYWEIWPRLLGGELERVFRKSMHDRIAIQFQYHTIYIDALYEVSVYPTQDGVSVFLTDRTEEWQAAQALRESEEKYRTIANYTYDWEYWIDPDGKYLYISPACERITGYRPQEFIENPDLFHSIVHPDDLWQISTTPDRLTANELHRSDIRIITRSGEVCWIGHICQPVYAPDGRSLGLRGSNRDITQRKLAEEQLRESEERYRQLIEWSPYAIIIQSDGCFAFANRAGLNLFGAAEPQQLLGRKVLDLTHPEYRPTIAARIGSTNRDGVGVPQIEGRFLRLDGSSIYTESISVPVTYEGKPGALVLARDITEMKVAREAARSSEARFQTLFESSPVGIALIERQTRKIVQANLAFQRMLGYNQEELIHLDVFQITHPGDSVSEKALFQETVSGERSSFQLDKRYVRKDGSLLWGRVIVSLLPDSGEPGLAIGVVQDISEQKNAEEALRGSAERYRYISELTSDFIFSARFDQEGHPEIEWTSGDLEHISGHPWDLLANPANYVGIIFSEDLHAYQDHVQRLLLGQTVDLEYRILTLTGEVRWIRDVRRPDWDEQLGRVVRVYGGLQDISARKLAEDRIRQSEAGLRKAQQVAHVGSWKWDIQTNQLEWSDEMYRIFGIEQKQFSGFLPDVIERAIHPEDRDKVEQANQRVADEQVSIPLEYRIIWPDQSVHTVWAEAGGLTLDIQGNPNYLTGIVQDISERKAAQEALRASETRFRTLIEQAPTAIGIARDGITIYTNRRYLDMFGFEPLDDLAGRPLTEQIAPSQQEWMISRLLRRAQGLPAETTYETLGLRRDGTEFPLLIEVTTVYLEEGPASLGFLTDLTQRKQEEQVLHDQIAENRKRSQELEAIVEISTEMRRAETRAEMIDLLLAQALQAFEAQGAALGLLDGKTLVMHGAAGQVAAWQGSSLAQDNSLFWQVISSDTPRFIDRLKETGRKVPLAPLHERSKGIQSGIFAPLKSGGATIGLLFLGFGAPNTITETQKRLTVAIAEMAGNALQRMSIADAVDKLVAERTHELETIYRVTSIASQQLELDAALQKALELILTATATQLGSVLLRDEQTRRLHVAAQSGLTAQVLAHFRNADPRPDFQSWVVEKMQPLVLPDLFADARAAQAAHPVEPFPYVGLPMRVGERVVGILEMIRPGGEQFNLEELTLLAFIGDHLGLVVENARLLHQAERNAVLEERSRMARELHDSVTQSLYSATLFAEGSSRLAEQGNLEQVKEKLADLSKITQLALKEMRLMVYELRSPALHADGLAGALQRRLDAVEMRSGIRADLEVGRLPKLSESLEEVLYRVALEALNNSLKHSAAQEVKVSLQTRAGKIVLRIEDDGVGFTLDEAEESGGFGLHSMRERVERLHGSLGVRSIPGMGTIVEAVLPHRKQADRKSSAGGINQ